MRFVPQILFFAYSAIALVAINRLPPDREYSIFARFDVFSEVRPRLIWYDLRARKKGETVFFSRDYASKFRQNTFPSWWVWKALQRTADRNDGSIDPSLMAYAIQFRELCGCENVEVVKFHGRLWDHMFSGVETDLESVAVVP